MHRRGVESIAPVGSAAGWTTGSFAVVDAKIVCNDVFVKIRKTAEVEVRALSN